MHLTSSQTLKPKVLGPFLLGFSSAADEKKRREENEAQQKRKKEKEDKKRKDIEANEALKNRKKLKEEVNKMTKEMELHYQKIKGNRTMATELLEEAFTKCIGFHQDEEDDKEELLCAIAEAMDEYKNDDEGSLKLVYLTNDLFPAQSPFPRFCPTIEMVEA